MAGQFGRNRTERRGGGGGGEGGQDRGAMMCRLVLWLRVVLSNAMIKSRTLF